MGASVDIFCAFDLWNTICEKNWHTNHILRKLWLSWGSFSGFLTLLFAWPASAGGTCKGKTAGY